MKRNSGSAIIEAVILTQLLFLCVFMLIFIGLHFYSLSMERAFNDYISENVSAGWNCSSASDSLYWRLSSDNVHKAVLDSFQGQFESTEEIGIAGRNATINSVSHTNPAYKKIKELIMSDIPVIETNENQPGSRVFLFDNAEFIRNSDFVFILVSDIVELVPFLKNKAEKVTGIISKVRSAIDEIIDGKG